MEYNHPIFVLNFEDVARCAHDINQEPHLDQEFWRLVKLFREYHELTQR